MYGGAARAPQRGGIVKIFYWEGEPQRELDTATTTSLRILQLIIRSTASTTSGAPLPPVRRVAVHGTAPIRHGDRTNEPYTPREAYNEPLIPHSTRQPRHTRAAFRLPLYLWLGIYIGDLGWGPRTRHLVIYYTRSAIPLG